LFAKVLNNIDNDSSHLEIVSLSQAASKLSKEKLLELDVDMDYRRSTRF
jgi:hypothetical protein